MESLKEHLLQDVDVRLPVLAGDIVVAYIPSPLSDMDIITFVSVMYNSQKCFHHRKGLIDPTHLKHPIRFIGMRIDRDRHFQKRLEKCVTCRGPNQMDFASRILRYLQIYHAKSRMDLILFVQ